MDARMRPMARSLATFRAALLIGWGVLGLAGIWYAGAKGIPGWTALPVIAAFCIEYPFYLVPAFPTLRERFAGTRLIPFALLAALLPYFVCCCGAVQFEWGSPGLSGRRHPGSGKYLPPSSCPESRADALPASAWRCS